MSCSAESCPFLGREESGPRDHRGRPSFAPTDFTSKNGYASTVIKFFNAFLGEGMPHVI